MAELDKRLLKADGTPYEHALAIQDYLRTSGGFTYSLTLATARDSAGRSLDLDPLSNFLVTKQGYCVQFATAMVMMARSAGIPARMAIGFLPGSADPGRLDGHRGGRARLARALPRRRRLDPLRADPRRTQRCTAGLRDDLPVDVPLRRDQPPDRPAHGCPAAGQPQAGHARPGRRRPGEPRLPLPAAPVVQPSLADRLPRGWGARSAGRPRRPPRWAGRADGSRLVAAVPAQVRLHPGRGRRGGVGAP